MKRERGFDFPVYKNGNIVTETFKSSLSPVVTGFMFNTRLPKFADLVVRQALSLLYDF